jgi:hypothetical protein
LPLLKASSGDNWRDSTIIPYAIVAAALLIAALAVVRVQSASRKQS